MYDTFDDLLRDTIAREAKQAEREHNSGTNLPVATASKAPSQPAEFTPRSMMPRQYRSARYYRRDQITVAKARALLGV